MILQPSGVNSVKNAWEKREEGVPRAFGQLRYPLGMAQQDVREVVVIGAGPAGILAALHAAGKNRDVLLIDGGVRPGQKILLSGGGRCNIVPEIVNPKAFVTESSPNTLRKILLSWPLDEVCAFLEKTVRLKLYLQKRTGKTFPVGGGEEAYERFHAALKRAKVTVRKGARVEDVLVESPFRLILRNKKEILARKVVVATGGCSYPETGSDGAGLEIARRLGHQVVDPYPALVPLLDSPRIHRRLAGISMDVHASARGTSMSADFRGGFVFTHRGYSGPAVMNVSHVASRGELVGQHVPVTISWSEHTEDEWRALLATGSKTVRGVLKTIFADRFVDALVA